MASARACLDVLRGASVLVQQSEEALMQLLAVQQSEGLFSPEHRDGRTVEGYASIEATPVSSLPKHVVTQTGRKAGQEEDAAQADTKRSRVKESARGQQQQQQQQHEHGGWQEDRDRRMLECLVSSLLRVLEGPSGTASSEAASASAMMPAHGGGDATEDTQEHGAAGVDRKRPRVDDAARGQQQQQQQQQQQRPRDTSSRHTEVVAVRAVHQPSASVTMATTASSIVLTSPDLMLHIIGYVSGVGGMSAWRVEVGLLALVCRAWRNAAQHESLWEPLAKASIPRLADVENATTTQAELQQAGGSYRQYLVNYGRLLSERCVVKWDWDHRLVLQFEIWDTWPVGHLFSGEGAVGYQEINGGAAALIMAIDAARGPSFSAASRSGPHGQYESIGEYLEALRFLNVRVTVHDEVTGRTAVLVARDYSVIGEVREDDEHEYRVDDDHRADDDHDYLVTFEGQSLATVSYGPMKLDAAVCFRVVSMSGNSALPDDQKWCAVVPFLRFEAADIVDVGRFVYSVLGY